MEQLPPHLLEYVADRFRVLGDANRLRIVQALLLEGELNIGELVTRLDMSQANVSKHVKVLQDAGIVSRQPRGTAAYLSVSDPSISALCDLVCERLREQKLEEARIFAS